MTLRAFSTNLAPAAIGPYSQGIEGGGLVFVSGQIGADPRSGELADGIAAQCERALRNVGAILDAAGLTYTDIVKTTLLLADIGDFDAVNAVYGRFFSDPPPARATYQVAALPRGARIEIEAIAARGGAATGGGSL